MVFTGAQPMRYTIKNNYEFRRLYRRGKSAASGNMVLYCRRNGTNDRRLGITVSTKIGKAVHRNKVRRRFREIYRRNAAVTDNGWDIIMVARVKSRYSAFGELEEDYVSLLKKLGIYKENDEITADKTDQVLQEKHIAE